MADFGADTAALTDRYEDLRREVLSKEISSPRGLSVFLRQGMVGWMKVHSFLTVTDTPSPALSPRPVAPLPQGFAGELTKILTELILARKDVHA